MTFNDKFKFLMDITNTNNTTLAGAVGIDNSAVSLYRSCLLYTSPSPRDTR